MDLLSLVELADILELPERTIVDYTLQNKIPSTRTADNTFCYKLDDVTQVLAYIVQENQQENIARQGKISYSDYLKLPRDQQYEVLEGQLIKDPSPCLPHQRVSRRLLRVLEDYFQVIDPLGEVIIAPFAVVLDDTTVVQPDLLYVHSQGLTKLRKSGLFGPPALVVEVLSPGYRRKDRLFKYRLYQQFGVPHYWLVDPERETLEGYSLRQGKYYLAATGQGQAIINHPQFPGLSLELSLLWQGNANLSG